MSGTRDENRFMARVSEQAERFEDMVEYMKRIASMGSELTEEERNLLSVAYKNSVGQRRSAWRAVNTLEQREASKGQQVIELIKTYRAKIEEELNVKCNDMLDILQKDLLTTATTPEAKVFYLKLKGDYARYLAEFSSGEQHSKCAQDAHDSYQQASEVALSSLPPTHPIRLGLALNFSVFYYEVFSSPEKACGLAKLAFDDAISVMDGLSEADQKDSATIMQLLRDNLQLWTAGMSAMDGLPPEQDMGLEDFS